MHLPNAECKFISEQFLNNYGIQSLAMPVPVYLKNGDKIGIRAPSDGGWAWVDKVDLIKAVE